MSGPQDPILSQFAAPPRAGSGVPSLEVDRSTGLLHEPGATGPFIEELIAIGAARRNSPGVTTVITEATDPYDPDLVRGDLPRFLGSADTLLTRGDDPPDPDLVRADAAWFRFTAAVTTNVTKTVDDPYDPDLVRAEPFQRCAERLETDLTRFAPDPDLVRAESGREQPLSDD